MEARSKLASFLDGFVVVAVVVELGVIVAMLDHLYSPSSRYGYGFATFIILAALPVLIASLIALSKACHATIRQFRHGGAIGWMAFYWFATLLPVAVWYVLQIPPHDYRVNEERERERVAGAKWAAAKSVSNEAECNVGSGAFMAGCRTHVRALPAKGTK